MTSILQGVNNQSHFKNSKWPQKFPSLLLSRVSGLRGLRILPLKYTNKIWCYIIFECSNSTIVDSIPSIFVILFFFSYFFFLSMKKVGDSMEKVGDSIGDSMKKVGNSMGDSMKKVEERGKYIIYFLKSVIVLKMSRIV
jgi:hypothetical protein